ncbi:MAG TPA: NADH-quinone oxidoreductase subunit D [Dehalococcoidia bacterium]|nr:NADH-quinone oxidoreductase subunit D [Dehalococcoidia bacterium]
MSMLEQEFETVSIDINMGPQHPSTHGVFRMVLSVDGELIVDVEPVIGYMHRGGEKLSETLDYRQGIGIQDRTDYLGNFNCEHCYVMAAEKLAGIVPPERAEYIRIICTELNRVASHMMFMGAFGTDVGVFGTTFTYAFRDREDIQRFFEELTGERIMYNYFRVGGVAWEVQNGFEQKCRALIRRLRQGIADINGLLTENEVFVARCKDVGVISAEKAIEYGLTGPMLRASGVSYDIRRDEPYSIYDRFQFDVPVGTNGDCYDRYLVRLEEMRQSLRIVEQALEQMQTGPIMPEKMPRMLRIPPSECYMRTENPRGEYGIYLVSKGGNKPYRIKMRSPSFSNLMALREMVIGEYVADAVIILGSTDIVLCEVDR